MTMLAQLDRALGCLLGGALGDAMGMPTQSLSPDAIAHRYGMVDDIHRLPFDGHPVSHGLPAGSITDDTEQTLLLAETILASPDTFDGHAWARKLMDWENDMRRRGRHDLLGPSTKRALAAIARGEPPEQAGRFGDTNGAAMRVAPVGIAYSFIRVDAFVAKVHDTCRTTHNTSVAVGGAAAVAAAVSTAIDGANWEGGKAAALQAARAGSARGHPVPGVDIAARIGWAVELVRGRDRAGAIRAVTELIGTSVAARESVPAAFAVVEIAGANAWEAAVISANLGGDTDTIGAIAAAMAGALSGASALPASRLEGLNGLDRAHVERLAQGLLAVRNSAERAVA